MQFNKHDELGNLLEYSRADGPPTSFIWGYDGLYPVAKVENISYNDIELRPEFGQNFSLSGGLSANQEYALRQMNNAHVTTFKYDKLIGVIEETNPQGKSTLYEYDSVNRLKHIIDQDGNIISQYQYNYKN